MANAVARPAAAPRSILARNIALQREIYGEPLGDRVRRIQAVLEVSQRRLADTLGLSTAMLSQLISARRVKIGDPAVLARMDLLDRYVRRSRRGAPIPTEALLAHVKSSRPRRAIPEPAPQAASAEMLRAVANPADLAAAANVLRPRFPALAELIRRATIERLPAAVSQPTEPQHQHAPLVVHNEVSDQASAGSGRHRLIDMRAFYPACRCRARTNVDRRWL